MKGYLGILVGCLLSLPVCAQRNDSPRVNLDVKNTSLIEIIEELRTQTRYNFLFNSDELRPFTGISIRLQAVSLKQTLDSLLIGRKTGLTYTLEDKTVVIRKVTVKNEQKSLTVKGVVVDKQKEPLPGVTIKVAGTSLGTATDMDGGFTLNLPLQSGMLEVSFVGFKSSRIPFSKEKNTFDIVLEEEVENLDEVVVTGVFTKAKESYTGAVTTITAAELKRVGNRNILSSIRNIDPSFNIVDNPTAGSDPNRLPDITIRGNSSMTSNVKDLQSESQNTQSANMPLFILDGFEITLERMMDLDDNQVESITLLKDASATAMYGTRGANGVVVITTKQPESGKLQLTYKGGLAVEAPDLTSYNLLNSREKLEYEKAAGLYTYLTG
ncbi:MAG: carboxypeptidase-like regulatory domain-containing protein, partial [Butyricimonas faecihominis]